jgi:uncharacterized RDD family membrane protein YckC
MQAHNAPLPRRLGAMLYDGLLVLALLFMATIPFIALRGGEPVEAGDPLYQLTMLIVAWFFYVGFWTRSGRTLGMQSWRLQLESADGTRPGVSPATVRFLGAILSWLPFGLGFWWSLWDREGLTWHDRLSGTRIRYYPKDASGSANEPDSAQTP